MSVVVASLFAAAAYTTYRSAGFNWITIGLLIAFVIGVVGIVESLLLRIRLTDVEMIVTDLRGTHRYLRNDIDRIEEARGSSPAIKLKDGRWVKLPSIARNLGNSVRAWLKPTMPPDNA